MGIRWKRHCEAVATHVGLRYSNSWRSGRKGRAEKLVKRG